MRIVVQLLIALAAFGIVEYSAALQCFTCDDCLDDDELTDVQICGEKTTKRPVNNESDEDDYSDDDEESGKTTLRPGTTKSAANATADSAEDSYANSEDEDDEDEDEDEDDDYDDDRRRRRLVQSVPRINEAVCYMIKVLVNDSVVTKRGCAAMRPNNLLTCQSLQVDGQPMDDCQLCNTNGCNSFTSHNMDSFALWNGAAPRASAVNWLAAAALTALLMRRNN